MDERTITAAEAATERLRLEAIQSMRGTKTYSVIVLGKNNNTPFPVTASNADERAEAMSKAGVNLRTDHWAAGYVDRRHDLQICGNDDEAKRLVENHLRRR